ncbi:MAG: CHASE2 domain-containing protein [Verrucomicrobiales bacterium]|nr:CHASE2 domain-containing protein [Verrucomicrobiales bacterium]
MRQRFVIFAVLGLALALLAEWNLRSRAISPLQKLNQFWLEFCIGNSGDKLTSPAVTVVRINDDYEPLSIGPDSPAAADGKLSRLDFATILGFVGKLNPKSVAFLPTPDFDESLTLNQTDIVPLKDAAMQLPRFVAASSVSDDGEQAKETAPLPYATLTVEGDISTLLPFTRTIRRPDPQLLSNSDPAFKTIESARDLLNESSTKIPLVAKYRDKAVPSIVLAAVASHAGVSADKITVHLSPDDSHVQLGEIRQIPINADGTFELPRHAGISPGMKTLTLNEDGELSEDYHYATLQVDEIAYTGEKEDEVAKRIVETLQGKFDSLQNNLVFIGFDRLADRRIPNGNGPVLSETMMLAQAAATIQSGRYIDWWPTWLRWLAVLIIAFVAFLILRTTSRGKFLLLWLIAFLAFFGAMVVAFQSTLKWTPPFFAFALFGLLLLIGLFTSSGTEKKRAEEPAGGESA